MQETYKQEHQNFSLTIKYNAKREASGEFTVRADDAETLEKRRQDALTLLLKHIS